MKLFKTLFGKKAGSARPAAVSGSTLPSDGSIGPTLEDGSQMVNGVRMLRGEPDRRMWPWPPENPEVYALLPNAKLGNHLSGCQHRLVPEQAEAMGWARVSPYVRDSSDCNEKNFRRWNLKDPLIGLTAPLPEGVTPAKAFLNKKAPKIFPDYSKVKADDYADYQVVSHRWKEAVESVEPGLHQFFPIQLCCDDGRIFDYFIFHCFQRVDCIDFEASGARRQVNEYGQSYWYKPYTFWGTEAHLVIRREAVAGRHHWIDKYHSYNMFYSAELAAKLMKFKPNRGLSFFAQAMKG